MVYQSEAGEPKASSGAGAATGPRHVGLIMDGNGRWAAERGLGRTEGHRRGVEAVRETIRAAQALGLRYITVFSFSSENWSRPPAEVTFLFGLLRRFIRRDLAELHQNGVRVRIIGDRAGVPADLLKLLEEAENLTRSNDALHLDVAFNYGGRNEIVRAARRLAREAAAGRLKPEEITEHSFAAQLDTAGTPDPDLIIRTSGELRISNFLLWQSAYSEFVFLPIYWPDFNRAALEEAIEEYRRRVRRYGGLSAGAAR
jgi:undecaprenyl diphosphate synthase